MAKADSSNAALGLHANAENLLGKRFGKLVITGFTGKRRRGYLVWECLCDCGNIAEIDTGHLKRERPTETCGCSKSRERLSLRSTTHGMTDTPEWLAWRNMIVRCTDATCDSWRNYGGRGITVCERWMNSFESFIADMGTRPSVTHSLDRYPDQDGNYEPDNCRWATTKVQANNTRRNRFLTYQNKTQTIMQWADELGIKYSTISSRLARGDNAERALRK